MQKNDAFAGEEKKEQP
ncbi:hypothetical protein L195_g064314, partial [Trifolium pratense]